MKERKYTPILIVIIFLMAFLGFLTADFVVAARIIKKNKISSNYVQLSVREPLNHTSRLFIVLNKTTSYKTNQNSDTTSILPLESNYFDSVYEGRFINTTSKDFYDWKINIQLPQNVIIDSFWNCEIQMNENGIQILPKDGSSTILPRNGLISFGFILTSQNDIEIKSLNFDGCLSEKIFDNPLFLTLFIITVLFFLIFITVFIMRYYMNSQITLLKLQKERDDLLIEQTMKTFVQFIDAKDEYTRGHSARVASISMAITKKLGYDENFQKDMYYMGLMHDIGKLAVPDDILNKTTRLSSDEWEIIQLHTTNGARMLKDFSIMPELKDAVLYHHERYDGKGYVNQLRGDSIPLCARIICVADSYDAMNTNRCYRLKFSKERIIQEIERCSGKQFDPKVVPAMVELIRSGEIEKL